MGFQLYAMTLSSGCVLEAFFTPTGVLVIGVTTEKEFFTATVAGTPFTDANWHSIMVRKCATYIGDSVQVYNRDECARVRVFFLCFTLSSLCSVSDPAPSFISLACSHSRNFVLLLQISHVVGRRPFGATSIQVHVDGVLRLNVPLKFPVKQGDTLASCAVGIQIRAD